MSQGTAKVTRPVIFLLVELALLGSYAAAFHRGDCTRGGKLQNPTKDHALTGYVIATHSVSTRVDCTFECLSAPKCVSVNYEEQGRPLHTCELNSKTRNNEKSSLKSKSGWTYYDNDEGGVNCGDSPGARTTDCKESCAGPGWTINHWNDCPSSRTGKNCELWTVDASSYDIKFPLQKSSNYVLLDISRSNFTVFTLSLWVNPSRTGNYTLVSYATASQMKEIALECDTMVYCFLYVKGISRTFYLGRPVNVYNDDSWIHLAIRWYNTGDWQVFVNGAVRRSGRSFQVGANIIGRGKLVLGQLQTKLGKGFKNADSFKGRLSQLNIWRHSISNYKIKTFAEACLQKSVGNVAAWREFRHKMHGDVTKADPQTCKSKAATFDFHFHFPSANTENYIECPTPGYMEAFTLCLWLKTTKFHFGILSYYANGEATKLEFTVGLYGAFNLRVQSNDDRRIRVTPLVGDHWVHLCISWENVRGAYKIYVDGVLRKTITDYQKGVTLASKGKLLLGVRQISSGRSFPFVGKLSHVNMWNWTFLSPTIEAMAKEPGTDVGNVISWPSLKTKAHGGIKILSSASYNLTSRTTDFDLDFGTTRSTANYAIYESVTALNQITHCAWFRSSDPADHHAILSYAVSGENNEFLSEIRTKGGSQEIRQFVKGDYRDTAVGSVDLRNGAWHHVCFTWNSNGGKWGTYLNGALKGNGGNLRVKKFINGGGKLILGQDQDSLGGGFSTAQAMVGHLAHVNVWDQAFSAALIKEMAIGADFMEGNVVPWHVFRNANALFGTVTVRTPSECLLPGITLQTIRDDACTARYSGASGRVGCCDTNKALFGTGKNSPGRKLRCYSLDMLKAVNYNTGYSYDESKLGSCYNGWLNIKNLLE